jgi:enoyl reductase-like protein
MIKNISKLFPTSITLNFPKYANCRIVRGVGRNVIIFENLKIEISEGKKNLNKVHKCYFEIIENSEKIKADKNVGLLTFSKSMDEKSVEVGGQSVLETESYYSLVQSIENSGRDYLEKLAIVVTVDKDDFDKFEIGGKDSYKSFGIKSFSIVFLMV